MLQNGADLCVNHGDTLRERRTSLSDEERKKKKEGENSIFLAPRGCGRRRWLSGVVRVLLLKLYYQRDDKFKVLG